MKESLISVVIANYNYGRFLEEAIRSVVTQDGFDECELIVVDGGSTDNSVEIIKKYANKIAWWVSEKDRGQSDAFNKGFAHATGRLGCWVNADDILLLGTLAAVLKYAKQHPDADWISGGIIHFDGGGRIVQNRIGGCAPFGFHWWNPTTLVGGPSSFFSIKKLHDVGDFDLDCHYSMDTDLWWKFVRHGMMPRHLHRYFWGFRIHVESKTSGTLLGERNVGYEKEGAVLRQKYGISLRKVAFGRSVIRLFRALSGSFMISYFDTKRSKGCVL